MSQSPIEVSRDLTKKLFDELPTLTDRFEVIERWLKLQALFHGTAPQSAHASFILDHGRRWPTLSTAAIARGEKRQCFANCQRAVVGRRDLTYVEGYAIWGKLSIPLPVHHAWLVEASGAVLDPTWGPDAVDKPSSYFGVPFHRGYILGQMVETEMACCHLDNPYNDHALLRGLHPDAVKAWS